MKKISLYLPEQQIAALNALSNHTGFSVSELIRRAISEYIGSNHWDKAAKSPVASTPKLTMHPLSGDWHLTNADACHREDPEKRQL